MTRGLVWIWHKELTRWSDEGTHPLQQEQHVRRQGAHSGSIPLQRFVQIRHRDSDSVGEGRGEEGRPEQQAAMRDL